MLPLTDDDRQVAAVHDVFAQFSAFLHKPAKVRVQLRRAARDVHRRDIAAGEDVKAALEILTAHVLLLAVGAGIHVAVGTGLVAKFARIDLKNLDVRGPQLPVGEASLLDGFRKYREPRLRHFFAIQHL